MKIKKKTFFECGSGEGGGGSGGGGGGGGSGFGGQGGCERRIEVFGKIHKKNRGGGRGSGWWGVRVDVNAMLWGMGAQNRRYCTILRKLKKMWGEGEGQYLNPKHSLCIQKRKRKKTKTKKK